MLAAALLLACLSGWPALAAGRQARNSAAAQAICDTAVRIMPLGDSITRGSGGEETDENLMISYRKDLWDLLLASGYQVDFVGSQTDGNSYASEGFDFEHEGHGGWAANQIRDNIYGSGGNWLQNTPADIILLHIGTNDIYSGQAPQEVVTEVDQILDKIDLYESTTGKPVIVLLARIIKRVENSNAWIDFNNKLQEMADARIADGDEIIVVDQETGAGLIYLKTTAGGDMFDNGSNTLHPASSGYTKMATKWKQALDSLLEDCNHPPVIDPEPVDQTSTEQDSINLQVTAGDLDSGQTLTYNADNLPLGLSITPSSGLISGTVDCNASNGLPYSVTVSVKDNGVPQLSDSAGFTWTVNPKNCKPTLTSPGNQSHAEGAVINLQILASDPDQGDTLTFSQTGLPPGLGINTDTGIISGQISYVAAKVNPYSVTVTVTDNGNTSENDSETFLWTVENTNRSPQVTSPGKQVHAEGQEVSLQVQAVDPDGGQLAYSATGLPPDLWINPATGEIGGVVAYGTTADSPYTVALKAQDSGGLSDTKTFEWQVTDNNRPPVLDPIGNLNSLEGVTVARKVTAHDPDGDALKFSAAKLPPGLSINPQSGLIGGVIPCGSAGTYTPTVTVTDEGQPALADSETITWKVAPGACQTPQNRLFVPAMLRNSG